MASILMLPGVGVPAANGQTQLVTYFNFNDSGVANGQPASAAALASDAPGLQLSTITSNFNSPPLNVLVGAGTTLNQAALDLTGAGQGLTLRQGASPGNNGNFIQFSFSSLGLVDLSLSYATTRTSTGFTTQTLFYSTDGTNFTTFSSFTAFDPTANTFALATFDLSAVNSIENQASVTFRLTFTGATNAAGTNTLDNIQVTAVPEPATLLGGALGLFGLCFHQRRRLGSLLRSHSAVNGQPSSPGSIAS